MSLNYIVDNLTQFSGLAAESERLDTLFSGKQPPTSLPSTWCLSLHLSSVKRMGSPGHAAGNSG